MRQAFLEYRAYPDLQQLVGELPWGQNLVILSKAKKIEERQYYLNATKEMGWSRAVLTHQIKSDAYHRHTTENKQHNFKQALPAHLAEQAQDAMKDTYLFDMLGITEPVLEAELERRMVEKIKMIMLELGYGFAFIGSQYRIVAEGREYFVDLLFFNRRLKCLVAIELKAGKYKPEYAGKMNFYLNLLNEYVKEPDENPAIGIILCSDRDRFEVEFSLKGMEKPVGVAEYQLVSQLPTTFKDKLPDPKALAETLREQMEIEKSLNGQEGEHE
jgi:predicted nuclease of restriction endonuclease-like (RecB) superfamily